MWFRMLALLGLGNIFLRFTSPTLKYANEAVLPFYILHQPATLLVGFFVLRWDLPVLGKYVLIMALALPIALDFYHFVVRRVNLLRVLFGMKPTGRPSLQSQ